MKAGNTTAAAVFAELRLSSSDGIYTNVVLGVLYMPPSAAGGVTIDSIDRDLELAAAAGASFTFVTSVAVSGAVLTVNGHDI